MADSSHASTPATQPPPAPPLPPTRAGGVFQKFIAPLSFNIGARQLTNQSTRSTAVSPNISSNRSYRHLPSQTTTHRTGIPIAAVDINKAKTHAILAGQEILKTVCVRDGRVVEDFNIRSSIKSSAVRSETASKRREYLPAKDVCWSKVGKYDTIIATAALNTGRIALYDVSRLSSSRIELAWIKEHTGQVNKLDFDPHCGHLLLSGSQDRTVRIWDIREPQSPKQGILLNIRQPVRDVRWSPTDDVEFALCTENGVIQKWDLRQHSGAKLSINAHERQCYTIDWHPDGRHLVSGGFDKYAKVWDLKNENKKQKPAFQLRAPQAILNVRWRPPCWSTNSTEKGHWQSAQLATSYAEGDPRIHIWDLRRPLLPFREHDRFNSRPTDILWHSEDFLWSVGDEPGMFVQTDVRYIPLLQDEISTSTVDFMPDGSFVTFNEDTRDRRTSSLVDPAAGFLRIPSDRLSGGTDGINSRSLSDEDDVEDVLLTTSVRRQVIRSSRSAKSQGNTPPTGDGNIPIVSLDQAVLSRNGMFNNEQIGMTSNVSGVSVETEVIEFLTENYALPMTINERKQHPTQILERLEAIFLRNASVCDYVSMHRLAQSWRILSAVIIPEIKDWADANRRERLEAEEAKRKLSQAALKLNKPSISLSTTSKSLKSKVMNNLFRGVVEAERPGSENESTSNMTTPTARPLPDSPAFESSIRENTFLTLNDAIEPMPPLPPSIISAHSTAAAASKALLDSTTDNSPASSPEILRRPFLSSQPHKRNLTEVTIPLLDKSIHVRSTQPQPIMKQASSSLVQSSPRMEFRKQEDRRAAIRDFRAQQRQPFTLEEPIQSPRYSSNSRHDSSESFPMFSASTDSSQRSRSIGQSFETTSDQNRSHRNSEDWQILTAEDGSSVSRSTDPNRSYASRAQDFEDESMHADFPMDEATGHNFGSNEVVEAKKTPVRPKSSAAASMWDINELKTPGSLSQSDTAASSASNSVFHLEETSTSHHVKIHNSNPIRKIVFKAENPPVESYELQASSDAEKDAASKEYIYADFHPIDVTTYETQLPWAWSALPLVCHSIAFDMLEGIACAQFSVQLLMHIYPFFFNSKLQMKVQPGVSSPDTIAERLMRPDLNHRIIEGLFLSHYLYLKKMALYGPMSELRNFCVELGFNDIFDPGENSQPVGAALKKDPFQLQMSCNNCYSFMQTGAVVCSNCKTPRTGCPVCHQIYLPPNSEDTETPNQPPSLPSLWTFCQACGHGGHYSCIQEWMLQPDAEGECPTRGCGCDCGPGAVRQQRITRQHTDAENLEMIRGNRTSAASKKDSMRVSPSPAVDRTRDTLRNTDLTRDSSGDEQRARRSFSGRGGNRSGLGGVSANANANAGTGAGLGVNVSVNVNVNGSSRGGLSAQSFGRRVRLVTPGEENEASQST